MSGLCRHHWLPFGITCWLLSQVTSKLYWMFENFLNCSNSLDGLFWWSLFQDICSSWQMWSKTFDKKNKLVCFYSTFVSFYILENDLNYYFYVCSYSVYYMILSYNDNVFDLHPCVQFRVLKIKAPILKNLIIHRLLVEIITWTAAIFW